MIAKLLCIIIVIVRAYYDRNIKYTVETDFGKEGY